MSNDINSCSFEKSCRNKEYVVANAIQTSFRVFGVVILIYALLLGWRPEWILTNISGLLFHSITSAFLLMGAGAGLCWMIRKRDFDSLFFPSTLASGLLGLGLLFAREPTVGFFRPGDFSLILFLCLLMGGSVMLALSFTTGEGKKH